MAGTFAHIVLVDSLCQDTDALDNIDSLSRQMKQALMEFPEFCELGAVSPDCPFLKLLSSNSARWGNVMHYWQIADFVKRSIPSIRDLKNVGAQKGFAWLLGYVAHLVTDLTIHPVINLRVGDYEHNKRNHRLCEMNQDVYIFEQKRHEKITRAEYIAECGIGTCIDPKNKRRLDPAIRRLWADGLSAIPLQSIHMKLGLPAPNAPPDPDEWFHHYSTMIDKFAEEGGRFPILCRYIAEAEGLVYPEYEYLDRTFVENLKTPIGTTANYEQVFSTARQRVIDAWQQLGAAIDKHEPELFSLRNGDLDTGCIDNEFMFWSNAV